MIVLQKPKATKCSDHCTLSLIAHTAKIVARILTNTRPRDSCREVFKSVEIMTLHSQYIYSLVLYTINNKHLFDTNNEIHKYRTRNNNNLHHPIANLSKLNISGIKVFNYLPQYTGWTQKHSLISSSCKIKTYWNIFINMGLLQIQ